MAAVIMVTKKFKLIRPKIIIILQARTMNAAVRGHFTHLFVGIFVIERGQDKNIEHGFGTLGSIAIVIPKFTISSLRYTLHSLPCFNLGLQMFVVIFFHSFCVLCNLFYFLIFKGADVIITYFTPKILEWLAEGDLS